MKEKQKRYRPKSFIKWSNDLPRDIWWELFEPSLINQNDLLKKEYEKYLLYYLREKKLKDIIKLSKNKI